MIAPQKANYKENIEDYRTLNIEDEIFYDNTLAVTLCYQGFLTKVRHLRFARYLYRQPIYGQRNFKRKVY
jgi:predicted ATPase